MAGENLNIAPAVVWVIAFGQLLNFGLAIWGLMSSGTRANARRLDEQDGRLQDHDRRLSAVEAEQRKLPTQEEFHDLELTMTQLTGALNVMAERLKPVEAMTERMQEWMIEQGRPR